MFSSDGPRALVDQAFGERHTAAIDIKLPTVTYTGQDIEVLTTEATVEDGWVTVTYRGLAPQVTAMKLSVTEVSGSDLDLGTIEYPRGDHTSLANDDELEDGETDIAKFFLAEGATVSSMMSKPPR